MPYCPKCKAEYDDGFRTCADCRIALVDGKKEEVKVDLPTYEIADLRYLISANRGKEADDIMAMLNALGIPTAYNLRRANMSLEEEAPKYTDQEKAEELEIMEFFGTPLSVVDIFVPQVFVEKGQKTIAEWEANNVIPVPIEVDDTAEDYDEEAEGDEFPDDDFDDEDIDENAQDDSNEELFANSEEKEIPKDKGNKIFNVIVFISVAILVAVLVLKLSGAF